MSIENQTSLYNYLTDNNVSLGVDNVDQFLKKMESPSNADALYDFLLDQPNINLGLTGTTPAEKRLDFMTKVGVTTTTPTLPDGNNIKVTKSADVNDFVVGLMGGDMLGRSMSGNEEHVVDNIGSTEGGMFYDGVRKAIWGAAGITEESDPGIQATANMIAQTVEILDMPYMIGKEVVGAITTSIEDTKAMMPNDVTPETVARIVDYNKLFELTEAEFLPGEEPVEKQKSTPATAATAKAKAMTNLAKIPIGMGISMVRAVDDFITASGLNPSVQYYRGFGDKYQVAAAEKIYKEAYNRFKDRPLDTIYAALLLNPVVKGGGERLGLNHDLSVLTPELAKILDIEFPSENLFRDGFYTTKEKPAGRILELKNQKRAVQQIKQKLKTDAKYAKRKGDEKRLGEIEVERQELNRILKDIDTEIKNTPRVIVEKPVTGGEPPSAVTEKVVSNQPKLTKAKPSDVIKTTDAKKFHSAVAGAIETMGVSNKNVDLLNVKDYKKIVKDGGSLYLSKDGNYGAYVKKDGYMGGLFKRFDSGIGGVAKVLQEIRVKEGGKFFDSYSLNEKLYVKNGFRPVARMKFDEKMAPKGWEKSKLKDRPDNVFFIYDPLGKYKVGDGKYIKDYNEAYNFTKDMANRSVPVERTGQQNTEFFTEKTENLSSDVPYEHVIKINKNDPTVKAYDKHTEGGNFTSHISKMIPGFYEKQALVASAISKMKGKLRVLDIGGSEGGFGKAIGETNKNALVTIIDPNVSMHKSYKKTGEVSNVEYKLEAFGGSWVEPDGTVIKQFKPKNKYDVINEDFTFQFVNNDRVGQVKMVKSMLNDDGLFITSEKFKTKNHSKNELKKLEHQKKYFSEKDLATDQEGIITGMSKDMVRDMEYEKVLLDNFEYVSEYWNAGNFKGYVATNSKLRLNQFLKDVGDLNTQFSEYRTPRIIEAGKDATPEGKYAGSINLEKYPEKVREQISETVTALGEEAIKTAQGKRGVNETIGLATQPERLQKIFNDVVDGKIKPNTALNDVDLTALRVVHNTIETLRLKSAENYSKYRWLAKMSTEALTAGSSQAGRTLRILREPAPGSLTKRQLKLMLKNAKKDGSPRPYIESIIGAIEKVDKGEQLTGWKYKFLEYRRNNLLTGVSSVVRSMLGNTVNMLWTTSEMPLASAYDAVFTNIARGVRKITGEKSPPVDMRTRKAYDTVGFLQGFVNQAPKSLKTAWGMLKEDPKIIKESSLYERELFNKDGAISGKWGVTVRTPQRVQGAIDIMVREPGTAGYAKRFAFKEALNEGLRGKAFVDRVNEILKNPTEKQIESFRKSGEFLTFQGELGRLGKYINKIRAGSVVSQSIVPFFNTHANILKATYARTPFGMFSTTAIRGFIRGSRYGDWGVFADRAAMSTSGTLAIVTLNKLLDIGINNELQGSWDEYTNSERDIMYSQGKQPNSIEKYNDDGTLAWSVSYNGYEPISSILRIVSSMQRGKKLNESELEILERASMSFFRDMKENPFMQGIDELIDLSSGRIDAMTWATRFIKSSSLPNMLWQTKAIIDPEMTEQPEKLESFRDITDPQAWLTRIYRETPGLTKKAIKKVNILGNSIEVADPTGRLYAVSISSGIDDKSSALILAELERLKLGNMNWGKDVAGIRLTKKQQMALKLSAGQLFAKTLESYMLQDIEFDKDSLAVIDKSGNIKTVKAVKYSDRWKSLNNDAQIAAIKQVKRWISEAQKEMLFPGETAFGKSYRLNLQNEPQPTPKDIKRKKTEEYRLKP